MVTLHRARRMSRFQKLQQALSMLNPAAADREEDCRLSPRLCLCILTTHSRQLSYPPRSSQNSQSLGFFDELAGVCLTEYQGVRVLSKYGEGYRQSWTLARRGSRVRVSDRMASALQTLHIRASQSKPSRSRRIWRLFASLPAHD
ncbi:hypothetical protein BD311DRAFT_253105 [Dichomitus squalens]|uniref:Uncharacterized protein n=1 Tax=Dichomitus squalens TaxID=114155 RepID=A0A4Q9MRT8_9APHY|nr:hypothetical protein BD311DRAFT_253105 [Dichomitus squalens]